MSDIHDPQRRFCNVARRNALRCTGKLFFPRVFTHSCVSIAYRILIIYSKDMIQYLLTLECLFIRQQNVFTKKLSNFLWFSVPGDVSQPYIISWLQLWATPRFPFCVALLGNIGYISSTLNSHGRASSRSWLSWFQAWKSFLIQMVVFSLESIRWVVDLSVGMLKKYWMDFNAT